MGYAEQADGLGQVNKCCKNCKYMYKTFENDRCDMHVFVFSLTKHLSGWNDETDYCSRFEVRDDGI